MSASGVERLLAPQSVRAPELTGSHWLNVDRALRLRDLRGRVVLLDFWTYCCINCMHVLPDLKHLERRFAGEAFVVIGVHCGKYDNEKHLERIRRAVIRHEIEHPVLDDSDFRVWGQYAVRAWPTLVLIDAEGYVRAALAGEGHRVLLERAVEELLCEARQRGVAAQGPPPVRRPAIVERFLSFPGKVAGDPRRGLLYVADTNHQRVVAMALDGRIVWTAGSGEMGHRDGDFAGARFDHPQGIAVLDGEVLVADTESHRVRALDPDTRQVTTLAGSGDAGRPLALEPRPASETALSSPWDLEVVDGEVYVANAGTHQLALLDPERETVAACAGTGQEARVDGPAFSAALAQPSGLAAIGRDLYFADSETSSIRRLSLRPDGAVRTVVGLDLFEFGDRDGIGEEVRLQHPLGLAAHGETLFVADTYNHKIKRLAPTLRSCVTWRGSGRPGTGLGERVDFDEPGGLAVLGDDLFVADTNNHRLVRCPLDGGAAVAVEIRAPDGGGALVAGETGGPGAGGLAEAAVSARSVAYSEIAAALARDVPASAGREERMRAVVDLLWQRLSALGVSWVGFYLPAPGGSELVLGPRRGKPACSPIGLHGVCGRAFRERRAVVVPDVRALGPNYVACDPADRSEVVAPALDADGRPWAALDLDSHQAGFFTLGDATGLEQVLAAAFPSP